MDIIVEYDQQSKELAQKQLEVDKLNEAISKLRLFDNPGVGIALETKYVKDNKIRELEIELRTTRDDRIRMEIEHKVFAERYNDLKKVYDDVSSELSFVKARESEEVNKLEEKIEKLVKELEFISKENKHFRLTDEKCRYEMNALQKLKEKYENKYHNLKESNKENIQKINNLENDLKAIIYMKNNDDSDKKKEEMNKKVKVEAKHKVIYI